MRAGHCTLTAHALRRAMASLEIPRARSARSHGRTRMARRIVTFTLLAALAASPAAAAAADSSASSAAVSETKDKVNINTASAKDLQKLDGVGRAVAERIVHYREEHGPFKRGEDLRKVEGIGAGLWERNR